MSDQVPASTRRQVYELTLSDLEAVPVWEYASDEETIEGQDEATVRPCSDSLAKSMDNSKVVRTIFTLADGTEFLGFVSHVA